MNVDLVTAYFREVNVYKNMQYQILCMSISVARYGLIIWLKTVQGNAIKNDREDDMHEESSDNNREAV